LDEDEIITGTAVRDYVAWLLATSNPGVSVIFRPEPDVAKLAAAVRELAIQLSADQHARAARITRHHLLRYVVLLADPGIRADAA
jgi:hypothetical protein